MSVRKQNTEGKPALELIEEAVHLLRRAPPRALALYYLGTVPFALGLLYYLADMSQSTFASEQCATGALGLSLLFVWMKTWQTAYARSLRAQVSGAPEPDLTMAGLRRVAVNQAILQSTGFILLPFSALITLPFGWVFAFYQNALALDDGESKSALDLARKSAKLTSQWPGQNHLLLLCLSVFGLFVFLNLAIGLMNIPALLQTLLGVETNFTRSSAGYMNTTFLAALIALTHLAVDPLIKAAYVLRCFYGESVHSGEDLKLELRKARFASGMVVILIGWLTLSPCASVQAAAEPVKPASAPAVEAQPLDHAIQQVIEQREYAWRLPRVAAPPEDSEKGLIGRFLDWVSNTVRNALRTLRGWLVDIALWLREVFMREESRTSSSGGMASALMWTMRVLTLALLAVALCTLAILLHRWWVRRGPRDEVQAIAVNATPDLNDENVAADQLPEDGWLRLAREMMERGELRLALRALYLASLAHLGNREFIRIARFKSNQEYAAELQRRARPLPELREAFSENVSIFERVWYGTHEVTQEGLQHFQSNFERIKAC